MSAFKFAAEIGTPYLTAEEAATYTRHPSVKAFRKWADRYGITKLRVGLRGVRFDRRELDRALNPHIAIRKAG